MIWSAKKARVGNWLDSDQPLSDPVLADIAAGGYQGIYRYAPLPQNGSIMDLSPGELQRILRAGLQCGLVQHPRSPQWNDLTKHVAADDALSAVNWATHCGYPPGAHICLDFEGLRGADGELASVNTPAVCIAWANAWAAAIVSTGYRAQLYVGYDVALSPEDLYGLHGVDSYWSDAGHRVVATRGCAMSQGPERIIHGVKFDGDVLAPDLLGDVPMVASSS